jgi:hypothetical protein
MKIRSFPFEMIIVFMLVILGFVTTNGFESFNFSQNDGGSSKVALFPNPSSSASLQIGDANLYSRPGISAINPPVNEEAVKNYIQTHPLRTVSGQPPIIISIQFTTNVKLQTYLPGEIEQLPDDAPVVLVKEKGPFSFATVPHPDKSTIPNYLYANQIFDATNGNYLSFGGMNQ